MRKTIDGILPRIGDLFSRVGSWRRKRLRMTGGSAMLTHDIEYYRKRATAERHLYLASGSKNVAKIHKELATRYQALIDLADPRPKLRVNFSGAPSTDQTAT